MYVQYSVQGLRIPQCNSGALCNVGMFNLQETKHPSIAWGWEILRPENFHKSCGYLAGFANGVQSSRRNIGKHRIRFLKAAYSMVVCSWTLLFISICMTTLHGKWQWLEKSTFQTATNNGPGILLHHLFCVSSPEGISKLKVNNRQGAMSCEDLQHSSSVQISRISLVSYRAR